eukprot:2192567-Amphidinium_carterae.1
MATDRMRVQEVEFAVKVAGSSEALVYPPIHPMPPITKELHIGRLRKASKGPKARTASKSSTGMGLVLQEKQINPVPRGVVAGHHVACGDRSCEHCGTRMIIAP